MSRDLQRVWISGRWIRVGAVVAHAEGDGYEIGRVVEISEDDAGDEVLLTLVNGDDSWSVLADHVVDVKGL